MFIPPLLPDELLLGYRGRLANIHHRIRTADIHQQLRENFVPPQDFEGRSLLVGCLATALNTSVNQLLRDHTLMPLIAAFPESDEESPNNEIDLEDSSSSIWLRLTRARLAMCPDCIEDDLKRLHFSYWRRSHQQPGLFRCHQHGGALMFIAHRSFLCESPDEVLGQCDEEDAEALVASTENEIVVRANALIGATLNSTRSATHAAVTEKLQALAIVHSGGLDLKSTIDKISTGVLRAVSEAWRQDLMPTTGLSDDASSRLVGRALQAEQPRLPAAAICFVTAVLVLSVDEGLRILGVG